MKISHAVVFFIHCIAVAFAKTPCGKWYSADCLGKTDRRFDLDFTNDLTELNTLWQHLGGFWITEFYLNINPETGEPSTEIFYDARRPIRGGNRPYPIAYGFYNETIVGLRLYSNRYYVYAPSSLDYCSRPVPEGAPPRYRHTRTNNATRRIVICSHDALPKLFACEDRLASGPLKRLQRNSRKWRASRDKAK